ncbi:Thioredoxin-like fold containing protein, partial [Parasponia andersonii]
MELYQEVASKKNFEVVYVSCNKDIYDSFEDNFSKIPWLVIPHSDSNTFKGV